MQEDYTNILGYDVACRKITPTSLAMMLHAGRLHQPGNKSTYGTSNIFYLY